MTRYARLVAQHSDTHYYNVCGLARRRGREGHLTARHVPMLLGSPHTSYVKGPPTNNAIRMLFNGLSHTHQLSEVKVGTFTKTISSEKNIALGFYQSVAYDFLSGRRRAFASYDAIGRGWGEKTQQ